MLFVFYVIGSYCCVFSSQIRVTCSERNQPIAINLTLQPQIFFFFLNRCVEALDISDLKEVRKSGTKK